VPGQEVHQVELELVRDGARVAQELREAGHIDVGDPRAETAERLERFADDVAHLFVFARLAEQRLEHSNLDVHQAAVTQESEVRRGNLAASCLGNRVGRIEPGRRIEQQREVDDAPANRTDDVLRV